MTIKKRIDSIELIIEEMGANKLHLYIYIYRIISDKNDY